MYYQKHKSQQLFLLQHKNILPHLEKGKCLLFVKWKPSSDNDAQIST